MRILNTDYISRIVVFPERKTTWYRWCEAVPAKYFLGFKIRDAKPAGWSDNGYDSDFRLPAEKIMQMSSIKDQLIYRPENLESESLFNKAIVQIELKNKDSDSLRFNSNKEAEEFAKSLAEKFPHIQL
jgi:hypothetical protein